MFIAGLACSTLHVSLSSADVLDGTLTVLVNSVTSHDRSSLDRETLGHFKLMETARTMLLKLM